MTDTVTSLLVGHNSGTVSIRDTIARTYERLRQANDPAIFISTRDEADVQAEADDLRQRDPATMPVVRRSRCGEGQHRCRGAADNCRVPGILLSAQG